MRRRPRRWAFLSLEIVYGLVCKTHRFNVPKGASGELLHARLTGRCPARRTCKRRRRRRWVFHLLVINCNMIYLMNPTIKQVEKVWLF